MREVYEESNINVSIPSIHYFTSQFWPFPRSLMLACYCTAEADRNSQDLREDGTEIEDVKWFTKAETREMVMAASRSDRHVVAAQAEERGDTIFRLPSNVSLAYHMACAWLNDDFYFG